MDSIADLDEIELELDEDDLNADDDHCIRNRINDFINSKLRGKLGAENSTGFRGTKTTSNSYSKPKRNAKRKSNRAGRSDIPPKTRTKINKNASSNESNAWNSTHYQTNPKFRPAAQIMRNIHKNRARYTDIVSIEKHKSRQKNQRKARKEPVFYELSSSDSEDDEIQRTELLERLIYEETGDDCLDNDYWHVIKLLRLIRGCNPSMTVLCLCALRNTDIKSSQVQCAVGDAGGIEILLNLASGCDLRCRLASLKVLKELAEINQNAKLITILDGVQVMINLIREENYDLKLLATEVLTRICTFHHARSKLRLSGGIEYLVCLLDISIQGSASANRMDVRTKLMIRCPEFDFKVGKAAACALWACSKSLRNRALMREAGIIPILGRLLKSNDSDFLVPVVGTLQECASDRHYQIGIRTEKMIPGLIEHLRIGSKWLKVQCATAFFKCGDDEVIQNLMRSHSGLQPLATLLQQSKTEDMITFAAAGAVWKAATNIDNAAILESFGVTQTLVDLLRKQPKDLNFYLKVNTTASERLGHLDHLEATLRNICGAISEISKVKEARKTLRISGGLETLTHLLRYSSIGLLHNINIAIQRCAVDFESLDIIENNNGVRRLISMLQHENPSIQSSAAWALCSCVRASRDPGNFLRNFVGALETAVVLLDSRNEEVLTAACALIAEIAQDDENLATVTDLGVIPILAGLIRTADDRMRAKVAEAIANCCQLKGNARFFGSEGVVRHLLQLHLVSQNPEVVLNATRALQRLSVDYQNAMEMNEAAVLRQLIRFLAFPSGELQMASVETIGNIRRLALMKDGKNS